MQRSGLAIPTYSLNPYMLSKCGLNLCEKYTIYMLNYAPKTIEMFIMVGVPSIQTHKPLSFFSSFFLKAIWSHHFCSHRYRSVSVTGSHIHDRYTFMLHPFFFWGQFMLLPSIFIFLLLLWPPLRSLALDPARINAVNVHKNLTFLKYPRVLWKHKTKVE